MADWSTDAAFEAELEEAVRLLDQDPGTGSPEEVRVRDVIDRVRQARPEASQADHPLAARLADLERRLDALTARRDLEDDRYRTSPGDDDGIEPLLGGDIRKSFEGRSQ